MVRAVAAVAFCLLLLRAFAEPAALSAELGPPDPRAAEYQLKAAYLYNFARFVEWPEGAFESPRTEIVIGILQPDPFGTVIDSLLQNRRAGGRPICVERFDPTQDAVPCHILFVPREVESQLDASWMEAPRFTLVVGESPGFAARSGMVNFFEEEERLRFEINPQVIRSHGLRVNSKLLSLAVLVDPQEGSP